MQIGGKHNWLLVVLSAQCDCVGLAGTGGGFGAVISGGLLLPRAGYSCCLLDGYHHAHAVVCVLLPWHCKQLSADPLRPACRSGAGSGRRHGQLYSSLQGSRSLLLATWLAVCMCLNGEVV